MRSTSCERGLWILSTVLTVAALLFALSTSDDERVSPRGLAPRPRTAVVAVVSMREDRKGTGDVQASERKAEQVRQEELATSRPPLVRDGVTPVRPRQAKLPSQWRSAASAVYPPAAELARTTFSTASRKPFDGGADRRWITSPFDVCARHRARDPSRHGGRSTAPSLASFPCSPVGGLDKNCTTMFASGAEEAAWLCGVEDTFLRGLEDGSIRLAIIGDSHARMFFEKLVEFLPERSPTLRFFFHRKKVRKPPASAKRAAAAKISPAKNRQGPMVAPPFPNISNVRLGTTVVTYVFQTATYTCLHCTLAALAPLGLTHIFYVRAAWDLIHYNSRPRTVAVETVAVLRGLRMVAPHLVAYYEHPHMPDRLSLVSTRVGRGAITPGCGALERVLAFRNATALAVRWLRAGLDPTTTTRGPLLDPPTQPPHVPIPVAPLDCFPLFVTPLGVMQSDYHGHHPTQSVLANCVLRLLERVVASAASSEDDDAADDAPSLPPLAVSAAQLDTSPVVGGDEPWGDERCGCHGEFREVTEPTAVVSATYPNTTRPNGAGFCAHAAQRVRECWGAVLSELAGVVDGRDCGAGDPPSAPADVSPPANGAAAVAARLLALLDPAPSQPPPTIVVYARPETTLALGPALCAAVAAAMTAAAALGAPLRRWHCAATANYGASGLAAASLFRLGPKQRGNGANDANGSKDGGSEDGGDTAPALLVLPYVFGPVQAMGQQLPIPAVVPTHVVVALDLPAHFHDHRGAPDHNSPSFVLAHGLLLMRTVRRHFPHSRVGFLRPDAQPWWPAGTAATVAAAVRCGAAMLNSDAVGAGASVPGGTGGGAPEPFAAGAVRGPVPVFSLAHLPSLRRDADQAVDLDALLGALRALGVGGGPALSVVVATRNVSFYGP